MPPTNIIHTKVIGINIFQPKRIIWSYLYLGKVALNHKKKNTKKHILPKNQKILSGKNGNGDNQPPKNMVAASAHTSQILAYSAKKKMANAMPEYST